MPKRYLIDITTSRHYSGKNAVGIVRVEREVAKDYLKNEPLAEFFYYDHLNTEFRNVSREKVCEILNTTQESSFTTKLAPSQKKLKYGSKVNFTNGDAIISAGLLWDFDYLTLLYRIKKEYRIFVAQIIHDIIPILMPEYCVPGMDRKFPKFILDAAWTADILYCNSESTLRDTKAYIESLGTRVPLMKRIEFGSDVDRTPAKERGSWQSLDAGQFVLYVSTIEPRKNHQMLFNIWRELYARSPDAMIPIVFVGRPGWNVNDLMTCITNCQRIFPKFVKILQDVSDEDLNWLYKNARFTVYPSLYEGWGLPIAESLAAGTPCLASNSASMPEVAGGAAELLHPLDYIAWRDTIFRYMIDDQVIKLAKSRISKEFHLQNWGQIIPKFRRSLSSLLAENQF